MGAYARNVKLAAYQSVSTHGNVAGADPHHLVLMLMDGALERLTIARGCIERQERGDIARKAQALTQALRIVAELRGSLDMTKGGALAQNLSDLYEYMQRRILRANAENNVGCIQEVASLLAETRSAWIAIGPEVRTRSSAAVSAG